MPPRDWRQRAGDIIALADAVARSTEGMTLDEFAAEEDCRDANIYRVGLIGEAANAIPESLRDQHPEIPWRRIRDMRNLLFHVYFAVSVQIVWDTMRLRVPEIALDMQRPLDLYPDVTGV